MGDNYIQIYEEERSGKPPKTTRQLADSFTFGERARNMVIIKLADHGMITSKIAQQLRKEGTLAMELVKRLDRWGLLRANGREYLVEPAKFRGFALALERLLPVLKKAD